MEVSRFRLLFLTIVQAVVVASSLPGCAWLGRERDPAPDAVVSDSDAGQRDQPIINPQVERRQIKRPQIRTEDFEAGVFGGVLGIEDFESSPVFGARLAYHLTEDFFVEASAGRARAGRTSYEKLSGAAQILTGSERDYTYYALSLGWNALPGEVFVGRNRAYNTAFYLVSGIGSTHFGGDDLFTVNAGFGYRVLPTDWLAVHFDVRDHLFSSDLLGSKKIANNLEATLGLSVFF